RASLRRKGRRVQRRTPARRLARVRRDRQPRRRRVLRRRLFRIPARPARRRPFARRGRHRLRGHLAALRLPLREHRARRGPAPAVPARVPGRHRRLRGVPARRRRSHRGDYGAHERVEDADVPREELPASPGDGHGVTRQGGRAFQERRARLRAWRPSGVGSLPHGLSDDEAAVCGRRTGAARRLSLRLCTTDRAAGRARAGAVSPPRADEPPETFLRRQDGGVTVPAEVPHICVCICTFRREAMLKRLLTDLAAQQTGDLFTYSVVVADNDEGRSAAPIAAMAAAAAPHVAVTYCVQPRRNIALTRNTAIAHATGDFIAFIDDDEWPTPRWLLTLFTVCRDYGVDGVLGPVKPHFAEQPPAWIATGKFYDRPSYPTGLVIDWRKGRTGNVLLARRVFEGEPQPFREEFLTG